MNELENTAQQEKIEQLVHIQRLAFIFFVVGAFSAVIAPYSGVNLPRIAMLALGIGGGFILLMLTFVRPDILVLLLVGYIPFSRILVGDFGGVATGFNLTNILIILIVIGIMVQNRDKKIHFSTSLDLIIILFCILGSISAIQGGMFVGKNIVTILFVEFKRWLTPILMYFLFINAIKDKTLRKDIIMTIMIVVVFVGLLGLKEFYLDKGGARSTWERSRIEGIAEQSNQMGAFFVYFLPLPIAFLLNNLTKIHYWALIFPILACVRALMLTISRGAMLSFAFAMAFLLFVKSRFLSFMLFLLFSIMLFFPQWMPEIISGRFKTIVKEEEVVHRGGFERKYEGSTRARIYAIQGGLKIIGENPIFGVGYGVFPRIIHHYSFAQPGFDPHNSYLGIACEMGMPALFIFILILFIMFKNTLYVYMHTEDTFMHTAALGFLTTLAGLSVCNFFGSRLNTLELSGYIWILAAIFMRESKELKEQKQHNG